MNPVIASLEENLKYIKIVAEPTVEGFTKDRGNTGDFREVTVQQFIASYLTPDYQIKKGNIFSKNLTSQNIDCVVLFPNHPRLYTPAREIIIAEGVYAAVEIKPDITTLTAKSEFHKSLVQIQSVKKIERKRVQMISSSLPKESKYLSQIPGIVFSFKSQDLKNIIDYMREINLNKVILYNEFPDMILSLNKGVIFYSPVIRETIFKPYLDEMCTDYPDKVIVEINETGNSQLIWFLRIFLTLPKPSIALASSIINDYLGFDSNITLKFHALDKDEQFRQKIKTAGNNGLAQ